jgi:hypothetical protein
MQMTKEYEIEQIASAIQYYRTLLGGTTQQEDDSVMSQIQELSLRLQELQCVNP